MQANAVDRKERQEGLVVGVVLVLAGAWLLLMQLTNVGPVLFLLPGLAMLALGIRGRSAGWMIPGGIVSGIGLGAMLIEGAWLPSVAGDTDEGAVFLVAFALGWLSITVLSRFFADETQWWPLIPGGILLAIGLMVLFGGVWLTVLATVSRWWPVVLIAVGGALLLKNLRAQRLE
jgi:hypothetical protein